MHVEIKTADVKPLRNTFTHLAARFGDKPASRYQEATYDIQEVENFHYRPLWQPDKEIFDASRTAIVMPDWYALKDPRQLYYMSYTTTRARQHEVAEGQFDYFDKRGLIATLPEGLRESAAAVLLPLRHYEWGANMNNSAITAWAYGAALTNATMFATMDRLGLAQLLSRIGLLIDGHLGTSLAAAKRQWLEDAAWQPLRSAVEHLFIVDDWFELFVAQNLVHDGLLYPLVYQRFEQTLAAAGAPAFGMLLTFPNEWYDETSPWVDAVCKTAAAESAANRAQLADWAARHRATALAALAPLADQMFGTAGRQTLGEVDAAFGTRLQRLGLVAA